VKSSERAAPGLVTWLVALAAFAVVGAVRPVVAERFHRAKVTSDVYPLPPPEQTVLASLGYRSALADALFANVLVSYGIHIVEHRRFEFVGQYLDTINALDPTFRDPYRYADTFLVLGPEPARLEDLEKARELLRRGMQNRPYDTDLWSSAGQFLAYFAPSFLPTPELKREFKLEGARVLARACELASDNENVPYQCMTAAGLLNDAGEREAAIDAARRLLQVTDDPDIERRELAYLGKKLDEREAERAERRKTLFRTVWKSDLPFVSKNKMLIIGPRFDPGLCAGMGHVEDPGCSATWRSWSSHSDPLNEK